jgi:adenylate cyclase
MATKATQRKLTAILSADVVGYSRLMGDDEEATLETLTAYRKVFTSTIPKFRGRVVDAKGDALLAEFAAVTDAVNCSVDIQRELAERNTDLPDNRRMDFRIGINLGEVMVKGEEIYGDGVNIAARLEALAEPGGVCISRPVYDQVKSKLEFEYEYLGEQQVKNISEPVRAYQVLTKPGDVEHRAEQAKRAGERSSPDGSEKPSVAVLPFQNMSGDPEQEFFGDGLVEDILTSLSAVSSMTVIARNSTFAYKGKTVDVRQVARDLGVRHVVEGSTH